MPAPVDDATVQSGVIVVELDDVVPRRHPDLPNLLLARTASPIEQRFEFLQRRKQPSWFKDHIVALRSDLSVEPTEMSRAAAKSLRQETFRNLRRQGFTVNRDTYIWTVYVIELDSAAAKDPGRGVLYVGETSLAPAERFEQHKSQARKAKGGKLHSSVVARYGVQLRMDLAPTEPVFDKESSKQAEAAWAEHLRSLGYVVKGGH